MALPTTGTMDGEEICKAQSVMSSRLGFCLVDKNRQCSSPSAGMTRIGVDEVQSWQSLCPRFRKGTDLWSFRQRKEPAMDEFSHSFLHAPLREHLYSVYCGKDLPGWAGRMWHLSSRACWRALTSLHPNPACPLTPYLPPPEGCLTFINHPSYPLGIKYHLFQNGKWISFLGLTVTIDSGYLECWLDKNSEATLRGKACYDWLVMSYMSPDKEWQYQYGWHLPVSPTPQFAEENMDLSILS